jgi:hypothetical protein
MVADLLGVTLEDMLAEVEREIAMRHRMYPQWKRKASNAMRARMDRQLEVMTALLDYLEQRRSMETSTNGKESSVEKAHRATGTTDNQLRQAR